MKKKLLFVACVLFLTGCAEIDEHDINVTPTVGSVQMEYLDFDLITDQKTGIVYIDNMVVTFDEDGCRHYNHVYTPYYGKNGKPCKFIDGMEVEE